MTDPAGLLGPRRLQELFRRHGIQPKRSLGQNFVVDANTIRKVVAVAGVERTDRVLEVGAGAGSLTVALAAAADRVDAYETDRRLIPVLEEVLFESPNVTVIEADFLAADLGSVGATKMVANLPYNIAATVVLKVLEEAPGVTELVVMTQKEVGERMAASPGSKVYGAPTVAAAYFADASVAARVSRRAFWPVPNVDSVLVRFVRHEIDASVSFRQLRVILRAAFGQRRKSLRNSLAPVFSGTAATEEVLRSAGIDPGARPESLAPDAFLALARATPSD